MSIVLVMMRFSNVLIGYLAIKFVPSYVATVYELGYCSISSGASFTYQTL